MEEDGAVLTAALTAMKVATVVGRMRLTMAKVQMADPMKESQMTAATVKMMVDATAMPMDAALASRVADTVAT